MAQRLGVTLFCEIFLHYNSDSSTKKSTPNSDTKVEALSPILLIPAPRKPSHRPPSRLLPAPAVQDVIAESSPLASKPRASSSPKQFDEPKVIHNEFPETSTSELSPNFDNSTSPEPSTGVSTPTLRRTISDGDSTTNAATIHASPKTGLSPRPPVDVYEEDPYGEYSQEIQQPEVNPLITLLRIKDVPAKFVLFVAKKNRKRLVDVFCYLQLATLSLTVDAGRSLEVQIS